MYRSSFFSPYVIYFSLPYNKMSLVKDRSERYKNMSSTEHFIAGGLSGFLSRGFIQPLDVLKIRFQLQVESTYGPSSGLYKGVLQGFTKIVKTEGVSALWKGHVPAQGLTILYGAFQFGSVDIFHRLTANFGHWEDEGSVRGLCGGLAGICGTLMSMPCDVVRTRLIAQGHPKIYTSMMDAIMKMIHHEGVRSLWRGLLPTIIQMAPQSALTFYFYTPFLNFCLNFSQATEVAGISCSAVSGIGAGISCSAVSGIGAGISCSAVSGMGAGVCAKAIVYPLDVLKKRIQMSGFEFARQQFGKISIYSNVWECIQKVTVEEGYTAWFKGLWPSILKSGVSTGLIFSMFELSCYVLEKTH